ncbi:MAG: dihydrofolate reductase [Saccharofermentanales bacterium]|jgi:dihydrofolate reductase|nr:dihydrofolate reductase [Bacillota bacterium]
MKIVVACDRNWGIGFEGNLLAHIRGDLKRFQAITANNIVVYGRKSLATFPAAQPLKNRLNLILTTDKNFSAPPALIVYSLPELLALLQKLKLQFAEKTIFIIGGASVYEQLLPYCDEIFLTEIDTEFVADSYFPDLTRYENWHKSNVESWQEEEGLRYRYVNYKHIRKLTIRRLVLSDASELAKLGLAGLPTTAKQLRSLFRLWNQADSGSILYSILDRGNVIGLARVVQPVLNSDLVCLSWQTPHSLTQSDYESIIDQVLSFNSEFYRLEVISELELANSEKTLALLGTKSGQHAPAYCKTVFRPDRAGLAIAFVPFRSFGYLTIKALATEARVVEISFWRSDEILADPDLLSAAEHLGLIDNNGRPILEDSDRTIYAGELNRDYLIQVSADLLNYLSGNIASPPIQYELLQSTEFQRRVWQEIMNIPYGSTATYEQIAARVVPEAENHQNYARAVGNACAANPLPLIIPCHRVIGKDSNLVGFSGGVDIKDYLLNLEMQNAQKLFRSFDE